MSDELQPSVDSMPSMDQVGETIEWEQRVPLLTNRFMVWDFVRVIGISLLGMWLVVALMGWFVNGDPVLMPWQMILIVGGIMAVLFMISCLILLNRITMLFGVGPAGVGYASGARERKWNRIAVIAGVLGGSASTTGAGLIAASQEQGGWEWSDLHRAIEHPDQRVITLRNSWRTVLRLYCTAENYERVRLLVVDGMARGAAERSAALATAPPRPRRRWYAYVAAVLVPVVATVLVTAWPWMAYEDGMRLVVLSTVLLIAAGLLHGVPRGAVAIISLIPSGYVVYLTAAEMFSVSEGWFPGEYISGWEYDTGLLAITLAGEAILVGLALWRLFGRDTAAG